MSEIRILNLCHKKLILVDIYRQSLLKAFHVFNVLENCRVYFILTIDSGFVKFIKKIIEWFFWIMRNLYAWAKLRAKTVRKAAECRLIKFFLLAIAQSHSPHFGRSFQWNQTTMRWSRFPKACHVLKILANCVDSMLFHCFYDSLKLRFKILPKRSHRICSNFAIIKAIMVGTYSLRRFLRKTPGTEKHNLSFSW